MTKDSAKHLPHEQVAISRGMVPDVTSGTYPGDLLVPAMKRVQLLRRTAAVVVFELTKIDGEEARRSGARPRLTRALVTEARSCGAPGQLVFRLEGDLLAVLVTDETLQSASRLAEGTRRRFLEHVEREEGLQCVVNGGAAELTEENGPVRAVAQAVQALKLAESWGDGEVVTFDASSPVDAANDSPARALVVEDDESIRMLVCQTLRRAGFHVTEAFDGREGLAKVQASQYDLVILDVMMPGVGGLEMCEQMRADPSTARVPVLMVSALADPVDRVQGLEIADDYLCKPFVCDELVARARALLRRAHSKPAPTPPRGL